MKRFLLPTATALSGIVLGYLGGRAGDGSAAGGQPAQVVRAGPAGTPPPSPGTGEDRAADAVLAGFLKGRAVTEVSAEELLALLRPEMGVEGVTDPVDAARMDYQYRLLASRLPPETTEELLALLRDNGLRGPHVTWLLGAYVERYTDRALAWVEKQQDRDDLLPRAAARISLTDPLRACEIYQKELLSTGTPWKLETTSLLAGNVARLGKAEFFKFYDSLPPKSHSNLLISGSHKLPAGEVPAYLAEVESRREESIFMRPLIRSMSRSHPEEIREWLTKMEPGEKRAEVEVELATSLSRKCRAAEADDLLKSAMAGAAGNEKNLLFGIMRDLVWQDPRLADRLVDLLPAGQEPTLEDVISWNRPDYPPETLLVVAKYLRSPEDQAAYLVRSIEKIRTRNGIRNLNATDFQILSHRLDASNLAPEAIAQGKVALETAREKALGKK